VWCCRDLANNSLSGTLPSDVYNADCRLNFLWDECKLIHHPFNKQRHNYFPAFMHALVWVTELQCQWRFYSIRFLIQLHLMHMCLGNRDLSNNNFSGNLRESSNGTLFCSSLYDLWVSSTSLRFKWTFSLKMTFHFHFLI